MPGIHVLSDYVAKTGPEPGLALEFRTTKYRKSGEPDAVPSPASTEQGHHVSHYCLVMARGKFAAANAPGKTSAKRMRRRLSP